MTAAKGVPECLWDRVAGLAVVIESQALERLEAPAPAERVTTHVRLRGGGAYGLGEDVGGTMVEEDDGAAFAAAAPSLPLAGEWTLGSFVDHLATLDLWPAPPRWEMARRLRDWAFESAALDLGLRQAGLGLPDALGRTAAPVRFVNSLGLGEPPVFTTLARRLERYPDLRFKLDARETWSPQLTAEVAATGAVDVIDFKGRYELPIEDEHALLAMYETVLDRFDGVILEDPHDRPEVVDLLTPHAARISFDAPITTTADVEAAAFGARIVNVKPSRIGSLRALLEIYAHCEAGGLRMYGGGMVSSGSAAARSSCSRRCSTPTRPTTSRRRPTTCRISPPGCRGARSGGPTR